nr:phasin family protein [uncultured Rhodopila sp.]
MPQSSVESIAKPATDVLRKAQTAAESIVKGNPEAVTSSGYAASAALQELTKAYQELAAKNAANLTAAIHVLSGVKTPAEFLTAQQKLLAEGVEAVVADSQTIAKLTFAVFTAAFEPVKAQIEALQKVALKPAG